MAEQYTTPVRTILIEDNHFIRDGWEILLKNEPDFKIVGSYGSFERAFRNDAFVSANLALVDLELPGMSGIDGTAYLARHFPSLVVLVCSIHEDDENIIKALQAGAVGFIAKRTSPPEFVRILREVVAGRSPMTPAIAQHILGIASVRSRKAGGMELGLTSDELEILRETAIGNSYKTIASLLSRSVRSVTEGNRRIYEKLYQQHSQLHSTGMQ